MDFICSLIRVWIWKTEQEYQPNADGRTELGSICVSVVFPVSTRRVETICESSWGWMEAGGSCALPEDSQHCDCLLLLTTPLYYWYYRSHDLQKSQFGPETQCNKVEFLKGPGVSCSFFGHGRCNNKLYNNNDTLYSHSSFHARLQLIMIYSKEITRKKYSTVFFWLYPIFSLVGLLLCSNVTHFL